jgi:hypothetical protein
MASCSRSADPEGDVDGQAPGAVQLPADHIGGPATQGDGLVAQRWEQTVAASLATVKMEAERRAAVAG